MSADDYSRYGGHAGGRSGQMHGTTVIAVRTDAETACIVASRRA